jgi:hypothetical protein
MATINCTKCGAPNELDPGKKLLKCAFCESQIYIDKSGAGFYYILPYQMDEQGAQGIFKRWSAMSDKAKDLEQLGRITSFKGQYFPVFMFRRDVSGEEKVFVEPARSTTLPGLHRLKVPPGDMKVFDQKYDHGSSEIIEPNIEMMAYIEKMPGEAKEQALVFFPLYTVEYDYKGDNFEAVIDGSSGEVFASEAPPRQAAAYYAVGLGGFLVAAIEGAFLPTAPVPAVIALIVTIPVFMGIGYYVAKLT